MNPIKDMDRKITQVYGEYDAVVSGGGLIGLTCATGLARSGLRVALVERRNALGWEIGRAHRMFAASSVSRLPAASAYAEEIAKSLIAPSATGDGFNAPKAELLFDRWVMEAGVDVLFHGWPVQVAFRKGVAEGLIVGTKEGYQLLAAPLVIETDDAGRLVGEDFAKTAIPQPITRSYFAMNTAFSGTQELQLSNNRKALVRGFGPQRCRVDVPLTQPDLVSRETEFHALLLESLRAMKEQAAGCEEAKVYLLAEEEWKQPGFSLSGLSAESATAASPCEGLLLAGPWLPSYITASSGSDDAGILHRILLGEAAAARP